MRISSLLLALAYSTVCLAQLDTKQLSATLNSTLTEVVGYFDFIESGSIAIDEEYTNIDQGRFKANLATLTIPLETNLDPTTGEAEALELTATVLTDLTDTDDGRKLFSASADININGNTMSLLKSVAEDFGECQQIPIDEDTPNKDHNSNIQCFILDGIKASTTVVDLEQSFQAAANYARQVYGTDASTDSLIADLFSSLTIEPNGNDLVLSFKVETGENSLTANITDNLTANVVLTIKEKGLNLSASGEALFEIRQVDEFKAKITEVATELAIRDSETHKKYYEDNLYLIFGLIEGFLAAEEDDDDEDDDEDDDDEDDEDDDFEDFEDEGDFDDEDFE